MEREKIHILVLAAGSSSRLGQPKQLLPFKGTNLLTYVVQECIESSIGNVSVVLGAHYEKLKEQIKSLDCNVLYNRNYTDGLGTSIATGVKEIVKKDSDGVINVLVDQPYFDRNILRKILALRETKSPSIIVSKYSTSSGPPVFFDKSHFEDLMALKTDIGAKEIIRNNKSIVQYIDFEKGGVDIDREEDLSILDDIPKDR
ncbi:MAG: nucleotidyltransferase family protein [Saprospiraceae bacterium]|nr:nucleotidyltransferase family protein [Bacteroidia bacterium]NNL93230.1 nucleotidyltransferase family protein [Saprospiraceae bacterium]